MAELTPRQRLFVAEYLKDLNAKHAAVRTGYSGKSRANGNRLMVNEAVRAEIERALAPRLAETETSAECVLVAIADIAFGDVRDVFDDKRAQKAPSEWDERTAAIVVGPEIGTSARGKGEVVHVAKIKRADRLRALERRCRTRS
ncbi:MULTISPECIES: terminase small subunit [Rhizobium]|uniref:terminase small subunit n=2 Tax=Rhizobium/Agrobacterium group TaxID=227290 RepID=UPI001FE280B8|nr:MULTISPECIES: terminase small subunit [Rhizobium]